MPYLYFDQIGIISQTEVWENGRVSAGEGGKGLEKGNGVSRGMIRTKITETIPIEPVLTSWAGGLGKLPM